MNLVCSFFLFISFFFCVLCRNSKWHQKWRENDFWEKSPVDSTDILRVKNFVEIALSRSVSEINLFLCLTQKFKMASKSGRKMIFRKIARLCRYHAGQNFIEIALSCSGSKINRFLCLTQKFKMAAKSGRKTIFGKSWQ